MAVECEGCAAAGGGVAGVGHCGELGASKVVAIHWEGGGDWNRVGVLGAVEDVDSFGNHAGEFGFAGAWDAAYGDHEACVRWGGQEFGWRSSVSLRDTGVGGLNWIGNGG